MAVFAVIFFNEPAVVSVVEKFNPKPRVGVEDSIYKYLNRFDEGDLAEAYGLFDPRARGTLFANEDEYRSLSEAAMRSFGGIASREKTGTSYDADQSGSYASVVYKTLMKNGNCHAETIIVRSDGSSDWMVYGHMFSNEQIPC